MYSDSDLESVNDVYEFLSESNDSNDEERDVVWVDKNNPPTSGLGNLDRIVEAKMDHDDEVHTTYYLFFDADNSLLRTTMSEECVTETATDMAGWPDLTNLLEVYTPLASPPAVTKKTVLPVAEQVSDNRETVAEREEEVLPPSVCGETEATPVAPFTLSPTIASRFLSSYLASCLLIPVSATANRRALVEAHASLVEGETNLDFFVGYIDREPYGWALPVTVDAAVQRRLRELHPGARPAEEADIRCFMRASRRGGKAKEGTHLSDGAVAMTAKSSLAVAAKPAPEQMVKVSKLLSSRMRDAEALLSCVEEAGGWGAVLWVAVDTEVALSTKGVVPVPLEFAFVPVSKTSPILHFFTHPGYLDGEDGVQAELTAVMIHGIPLRGVRFLRHDYGNLAKLVEDRYLRDKRVILINKGAPNSPALADPQSIRWLFAAAACTASTAEEAAAFPVPSYSDLRCFDISSLKTALSHAFPPTEGEHEAPPACVDNQSEESERAHAKAKWRDEGRRQPSHGCWYHRKVCAACRSEDDLHCAQSDAWELRDVMAELLKRVPSK